MLSHNILPSQVSCSLRSSQTTKFNVQLLTSQANTTFRKVVLAAACDVILRGQICSTTDDKKFVLFNPSPNFSQIRNQIKERGIRAPRNMHEDTARKSFSRLCMNYRIVSRRSDHNVVSKKDSYLFKTHAVSIYHYSL